jgi:DNA invertase Pin-like site-specific DNA recombinase
MHTFAYLRVSTAEQTTDNQRQEIEAAGFKPTVVYAETISGKSAAAQRPEFARMLDTIGRTTGDKVLVVTKLDGLGRDASDVLATMKGLRKLGCGVRVLQLGDLDLASPAGKLMLTMLSAVAEMERDLLVERTQAGLRRAKAEGITLGRPPALPAEGRERARQMLRDGATVSATARALGVSRATILRATGEAA